MVANALGIAGLVIGVGSYIHDLVRDTKSDNDARSDFTRKFVEEAAIQYPNYNVVIIHTRHDRWGTWIHQHYEFPISLGRTIGYEIYFAEKGKGFSLRNDGDGGWLNWAYCGEFNRDGNHIAAREYSNAPANQVIIYDDVSYFGGSQVLEIGSYDWGQFKNDTISSLRVPGGIKVTVFNEVHFSGSSKTFTGDTSYVGDDFNDKISSIIVERY
jgi:hypothetical protein